MTWAGYPQNVSVARGPRSIFAGMLALPAKISASKIIGILRAARDKNSIMADSYLIRPITDDEYDGFRLVMQHAFHGAPSRDAPPWRRQLFEIDRSLAAFDPARQDAGPVGTTGIYSFGMAVPGGVLPVAGVTMVGVLPTHRRRGILRSIMRRQLADIAARGEEPIAALWASETAIYGRYGYGKAAGNAYFKFGRGGGALGRRAPADPALSLRLAKPADVVSELAKVYAAVLAGQPGFFTRSDAWWARVLHDPEEERHGFGPQRCLLAEDGNGIRGYALYAAQGSWDDQTDLPDGVLEVRELIAADPAAGAALWHDLLGRDLIAAVIADHRPGDDPVLYQLLDARQARSTVRDGIWVRIIDLPAALARRAYACPVDAVLEVTDEMLPGNAGRWRLRAAVPAGGQPGDSGPGDSGTASAVTCERTSDPADIALDVRELAAAYLGGTRLGTLAAAGLVTELRPGTLGALSAAFTWDPAPWCPRVF
jgi:predicted acetyltransferase